MILHDIFPQISILLYGLHACPYNKYYSAGMSAIRKRLHLSAKWMFLQVKHSLVMTSDILMAV